MRNEGSGQGYRRIDLYGVRCGKRSGGRAVRGTAVLLEGTTRGR